MMILNSLSKKVGVLVSVFLLFNVSFPNRSYGSSKTTIGVILTIVGVAAAIYGFSEKEIKTDISNPGLTTTSHSSGWQNSGYWAVVDGTVKNTGNVNLQGVIANVKYYDNLGNYIDIVKTNGVNLNVNNSNAFETILTFPYPYYPIGTYDISYTYSSYTPTYSITKEKNNTSLGYGGALVALIGIGMSVEDEKKPSEKKSRFSITPFVKQDTMGLKARYSL